jgi:hypothetical protein
MGGRIVIDGADAMAAFLERRIADEIRLEQAAAERAYREGNKRAAAKLQAVWVARDELGGMISCWMQEFTAQHRAAVLMELLEGWPKIPSDDDWDSEDDELAEAAD